MVHPGRIIFVFLFFAASWFFPAEHSLIASLWPSITAVLAVFLLRSVFVGLFLGALSGTVLLHSGDLLVAVESLLTRHLGSALQSSWNLSVLFFSLLIGGFVSTIEYGGGLSAIISHIASKEELSGKQVQSSTFFLGLLCFFDGLANSMLVGRVMVPLADKASVPRERIAYIADSTSAPVACLAFISTWIAYQLSMINEGLKEVGREGEAYYLFLQSIPPKLLLLFLSGFSFLSSLEKF